MTFVVAALALAVLLLTFLVAGLLRSHAVILRRLHELGAGVEADANTPAAGHGPRGVPRTAPTGRVAADVEGRTLDGDAVALRVTDVDHDTVLLFLSSGCLTCAGFWEALGSGLVTVPAGARVVVVARDADQESPATLAELAPDGIRVVLSSSAWEAYAVPGSPYVVHVSDGRVRGEGTGGTWDQVATLLAEATGDLGYVGGAARSRRAAADLRREEDTDRALLAAGIAPGDPRLYPSSTDRSPS